VQSLQGLGHTIHGLEIELMGIPESEPNVQGIFKTQTIGNSISIFPRQSRKTRIKTLRRLGDSVNDNVLSRQGTLNSPWQLRKGMWAQFITLREIYMAHLGNGVHTGISAPSHNGFRLISL
jgi:hypothetical protein